MHKVYSLNVSSLLSPTESIFMVLCCGRSGGAAQVFGGWVLGDWFARKMKGDSVFTPMQWKTMGQKMPEWKQARTPCRRVQNQRYTFECCDLLLLFLSLLTLSLPKANWTKTKTKSWSFRRNLKVWPSLDEYFLMVLFVLLLKRVHFLAKVTWRCDHSNESSWWVYSNGTLCVITKESSFSCKGNLKAWPLKWKLLMSTF